MKVITFSIFKGGTGKTTSAVNTAAALVKKGKRVLLADLDQSAQSTKHLGLDTQQSPNLYEVYTGTKPAALAIRKTRFGIDVLTSHPLMAAIEEALEPGDEVKLAVAFFLQEYLNMREAEKSRLITSFLDHIFPFTVDPQLRAVFPAPAPLALIGSWSKALARRYYWIFATSLSLRPGALPCFGFSPCCMSSLNAVAGVGRPLASSLMNLPPLPSRSLLA